LKRGKLIQLYYLLNSSVKLSESCRRLLTCENSSRHYIAMSHPRRCLTVEFLAALNVHTRQRICRILCGRGIYVQLIPVISIMTLASTSSSDSIRTGLDYERCLKIHESLSVQRQADLFINAWFKSIWISHFLIAEVARETIEGNSKKKRRRDVFPSSRSRACLADRYLIDESERVRARGILQRAERLCKHDGDEECGDQDLSGER